MNELRTVVYLLLLCPRRTPPPGFICLTALWFKLFNTGSRFLRPCRSLRFIHCEQNSTTNLLQGAGSSFKSLL